MKIPCKFKAVSRVLWLRIFKTGVMFGVEIELGLALGVEVVACGRIQIQINNLDWAILYTAKYFILFTNVIKVLFIVTINFRIIQ